MKTHTFPKIMAFLSIILCLTPAAFAITVNDLLSSTTKTITYSSTLAFTSNGTMVDVVNDPDFRDGDEYYYFAVAYKITLQEDDRIKIHSSKEGDSHLYLYKSDGTGGYGLIDDDDDSYGSNADSYLEFTAEEAGNYYIVVTDHSQDRGGRYDLTVWNTENEPGISSYTQIAYTPLSFSGSSASANGILNAKVKFGNSVFNAAGYNFNAIADKTYKITVRYTQSESSNMSAVFYILKDDLEGYLEDDIISEQYGNENSTTELTLTVIYKSSTGGEAKILLGVNSYYNGLNYTVTVDEAQPITLAQLLNSTTKTIPYSSNLAFTSNGTMVDVVNDPDFFKYDDGYYFAVAYKITLQEDDHIEIHSSKEGDSHLYLYKSDGEGGYEFITDADDYGDYDNNDSYLDFTADEGGDYYIVVSDYNPNRGGRYYLTVWNTNNEPANDYPVPIIAKAPKANTNTLKASVQNGTLHLSGLTTGKTWSIYTVSGALVHNGVASGTEANLRLNASGVYLVKSNGQAIRVINR